MQQLTTSPQSLITSQPLTQQLQAESANLQKLKDARVNAGKILNRYPDYSKATPGYTASIIEALASFDADTQSALAHPTEGICGKCKFLPTVADIVEFAKEREQRTKASVRPAYLKVGAPALEYHVLPEARSKAVEYARSMVAELRERQKPELPPSRVYTREELIASRDRLLRHMAGEVA